MTRLNTTVSNIPISYASNSSHLEQLPAIAEVAVLEDVDMAIVVSADAEAKDVAAAVIDMTVNADGQATDMEELVVIEVPIDESENWVGMNSQDSGKSLFIVLWGEVVEEITDLEATDKTDSDHTLTPLANQAMQVLPAIINVESYQLDPQTNTANKRRSIAAWIAIAGITRLAWSALDRFFLNKQENNY